MSDISKYGYHGRILEVDLTEGRVEAKPLDPDLVRDYLGGRGLATRLFYDAVDPACDPLGPDNVVVIATSPLVGTNAPTSCRGHMVFKSPLTGFIGTSNSGGTWANAFKATGHDVLIIKGRSSEPVTLDIRPGAAKLIPAGPLWGKDIHETTEALSEGAEPGNPYKVLCIGPAGENLVRIAAVANDRNRVYGRCGPGAVFGSKKLKAVRVSGREKTAIKDRDLFKSGLDQAVYLMKQAPVTKRLLRELGTAGLVELINLIGMLPHRNFRDSLHRDEDVGPDLRRDPRQDLPRTRRRLLPLPHRLSAAHVDPRQGRPGRKRGGPRIRDDHPHGAGLRHLRPRGHHPGQLPVQRARDRHHQLRRDRGLRHGALRDGPHHAGRDRRNGPRLRPGGRPREARPDDGPPRRGSATGWPRGPAAWPRPAGAPGTP